MSLTNERFIGEDSAKLARIQRLISAEVKRIAALKAELENLYNESKHRRWLAARGRLRDLMSEEIWLRTRQL